MAPPPVYAPGANKANSNQKHCPHKLYTCGNYANFFVSMPLKKFAELTINPLTLKMRQKHSLSNFYTNYRFEKIARQQITNLVWLQHCIHILLLKP